MSALIEETLLRVRGGPRSGVMPTLEVHVRGDAERRPARRREPDPSRLGALQLAPLSTSVPPTSASSSLAPPRAESPAWWATRRAALAAASAAGCLLLVGIALVAGSRESGRTSHAEAAAGWRPRRRPHATCRTHRRGRPRLAPGAQITLDGASIPINPFHARYAKDCSSTTCRPPRTGTSPRPSTSPSRATRRST